MAETGPAASVVSAFDSLVLESAQDMRALQRRAQERADNLHQGALATFNQIQQQTALMFLQQAARTTAVDSAYAGNHQRRASEVDSQEATAEGAVYKGESLASFPQTQAQHSAQFLDLEAKIAGVADLVSKLIKGMSITNPQTGGHAAEAPSGLNQGK